MPDLTDNLEQIAAEPASATVDGQTATNHPIPDVIALDKYFAAKAAVSGTNKKGGAKSGWRGLRPGRVVPPGAV